MKKSSTLLILIFTCASTFAQTKTDSLKKSKFSNHFQLTTVMQNYVQFNAAYSGNNSLNPVPGNYALSLTSTLFLGHTLWKNASAYFNPEVAGGRGINGATGIAGFTNGETFRIGDPTPELYIARAFIHQNIALPGATYNTVVDDVNQVNEKVPDSRISISAGKFAISDFFDNNKYSHDPRTQFLNWSLMSNAAWDYPANTRGYTIGVVVELIKPTWAVRASIVQEPKMANGPKMDPEIAQAHGTTVEIEKSFKIHNQPGVVKILGFYNQSQAPSYSATLKEVKLGDSSALQVFNGKKEWGFYGGVKYGGGINITQDLNNFIGLFARASWNDGKTATWAFTEIDQTASLGLNITGKKWKRADDKIGIAGVINGISADHRAFLNAGFYGFMIGDGKLTNYAPEMIGEAYYMAKLFDTLYLCADYQLVNNPAYNKDRGPVNVFAVRVHLAF